MSGSKENKAEQKAKNHAMSKMAEMMTNDIIKFEGVLYQHGEVTTEGGGFVKPNEEKPMTENIEYYYDVTQGSDEWLRLKHGLLSASVFKNVITPHYLKLSQAANTRLFYDEILSQRIDETIYPNYMSYDMMRGHEDEPYAVQQYAKEYDRETRYCGFIINNTLGFPLGYSPDALVGDDGLLEVKSKSPKYQIKTILDHITGRTNEIIPAEDMMQLQAGLFISGRKWIDFVSFCNGNQMVTIPVRPDPEIQEAIKKAAIGFEEVLQENMAKYKDAVANDRRLTLTPRRIIETEMVI